MFIVFLLVYKNLIVVLLSPFMSPLSVKVEETLTGVVQKSNLSDISLIMRGLRLSLRNLFKEILFTIPLFLLSFIPLVGLIFTFFILIIQAYYAGFGNMDYALERYFKSYESIAFIRKNRGLAVGNGAGFLLLLLIPVAGLFLAPVLATVAGSMSAIKRLSN
jgi:CysZ protein